jgi:hypothetical protein
MQMRTTDQTIEWYQGNETWPAQIGFDPDGMCLKICRTARDLPAKYPSALSAQVSTPTKYRVTDVSKIERGMVVYYDEPGDSNPYGHIVTVVGRVRGADRSELSSLLVRTNSVKTNEIVVTRGDYFTRYWNDAFTFASTWLNGFELDLDDAPSAPKPKPPLSPEAPNLRAAIAELQEAVKYHDSKGNERLVRALKRDIAHIRATIDRFS